MMHDPEQLFEGWLSGSLSEEEVDMFLERMGEGAPGDPWPVLIDQLIHDPGIAGMGNAGQRERLFQQMMEQSHEKETRVKTMLLKEENIRREPGRRTIMRALRWAAAAVLILLAVSGYWWYNSFPGNHGMTGNSRQVIKSDLLPGSNKAILTLGDGSTIILDSSKKGELAQQSGASIFKTGNGQIAYKQTASANQMAEGQSHSLSGRGHSPIYNTLTTPRGGQFKLVLPDGSGVWLNAASSITYPTAFTGKERKVEVTGEVYFEVAKNISMPFRVRAKEMEVTVLGTAFDISVYEDETSLSTTLIEGAVKISKGDRQELLQPGQQAQLNEHGNFRILPGVDVDAVMAWKNGYFSFHHTDLKAVMRQLARWYDVSVEYQGNMPDMKFGGDIPRSANASQVLHILEESKIHCTIEGKKIIVRP